MSYNIQKVNNFVCQQFQVKTSTEAIVAIDKLKLFPASWAAQRKLSGYLQHFLNEMGKMPSKLVVDGFYGGQTDYIFTAYLEYLKTNKVVAWRTDIKPDKNIQLSTQYPNYTGIPKFYGDVATVASDIITVTVPYTHYLSWNNKAVTKVSCHKKISESYLSVLEDVKAVYGEKEIHRLHLDLFGGAYTAPPRNMRGGNKYSTHCWGIAFDYDPDHNQLKWGRDKAAFAKPDYADWLNIWDKHEAINLGEIKNYDWMHFQFSKP